jgi:16S rRNA processing protein RimM
MSKHIIIGKILSPHGIKGLFHLASYAQNPKDIFSYNIFDNSEDSIKLEFVRISSKSKNDDIFIASIKGVNDRDEVTKLTNKDIFITRESFPEAGEGEYFFSDLRGLKVFNQDDKEIGKVADIADFGAGTLLEVDLLEKKKSSIFFPFNDNCIIEVNLDRGMIKLNTDDYE